MSGSRTVHRVDRAQTPKKWKHRTQRHLAVRLVDEKTICYATVHEDYANQLTDVRMSHDSSQDVDLLASRFKHLLGIVGVRCSNINDLRRILNAGFFVNATTHNRRYAAKNRRKVLSINGTERRATRPWSIHFPSSLNQPLKHQARRAQKKSNFNWIQSWSFPFCDRDIDTLIGWYSSWVSFSLFIRFNHCQC